VPQALSQLLQQLAQRLDHGNHKLFLNFCNSVNIAIIFIPSERHRLSEFDDVKIRGVRLFLIEKKIGKLYMVELSLSDNQKSTFNSIASSFLELESPELPRMLL
jgi:predicted HAD superfamily hydrolase